MVFALIGVHERMSCTPSASGRSTHCEHTGACVNAALSVRHTNNVRSTNGHTLRAPSCRLYYSFLVVVHCGQLKRTLYATDELKLYKFRSFLHATCVLFCLPSRIQPMRMIPIQMGNTIKHAFWLWTLAMGRRENDRCEQEMT